MCILIKQENVAGEIAQEDIVCYKVVRIIVRPDGYKVYIPYYHYEELSYQIGKTCDSKINLQVTLHPSNISTYSHVGHAGFHSYVELEDAQRKLDKHWYGDEALIRIRRTSLDGSFSHVELEDANKKDGEKSPSIALCKFVIPKGTRFYRGFYEYDRSKNFLSASIRFEEVIEER